MEHTQIYPQSGYVEHDPIEIWNNTKTVSNNVLQQAFENGINESDIKELV